MKSRPRWQRAALLCPIAILTIPCRADDGSTPAKSTEGTPAVTITGRREITEAAQFPGTVASVSQEQMQASVNSVDVEDAAKYLPSLFIRKRNYGDTQPVLATRTWGLNSSARTLVYVDDIPISALIANNNTIGAPRWGVVAPEQLGRIDMLYGPFSAAYSGNSMGGVMRITTREPETTEVTFKQTQARQSFDLYRTDEDLNTSQTSATVGGRTGALGWFIGGNYQNSYSQPLSLVTAATAPGGTTGTIPANNKLGQPANVLGASGLLHTKMANAIGKLSYDVTDWLEATYLVSYWRNDADSHVQSYLTDTTGASTFGRTAGFASGTYDLLEEHLMNGVALKSDTGGKWDGEAIVTYYDFMKDRQLTPAGVTNTGTGFTTNGRLANLEGTGWGTVDLKGVWRPTGVGGPHEISFGAHDDRYVLKNPTTNLADWHDASNLGSLSTSGRGKTSTEALWAQDAWQLATQWQAVVGVRYEHWKASEGFNFSGTTGVTQPERSDSAVSPKLTVGFRPDELWSLNASIGRAVRFPTVSELYQLVSTGTTFTSPNPNLSPERATSAELSAERVLPGGSIRVSLFNENTRDALIAETSTLATYPVPVSFVVNVGEVRNRGVELAWQKAGFLISSVELAGSVTYVDSRTLSDDKFASASGTTTLGKRAPYIPRWRATLVTTYRPVPRLALSLAGRYSGQMYSTVDNTDTTPHVYGAFDPFFVMDARGHYDITDHVAASLGVDNLGNRKYFLFHPFPERTYVADLQLRF